jgi:hypothetical protein
MRQEGLGEFINEQFYSGSDAQEVSRMVTPIYGFRAAEDANIRGRATHKGTDWTEPEEQALRQNFHAAEIHKWRMIAASVSLHRMRPKRLANQYRWPKRATGSGRSENIVITFGSNRWTSEAVWKLLVCIEADDRLTLAFSSVARRQRSTEVLSSCGRPRHSRLRET